jgi:uncharacterized membrane protein
MTYDFSSLTYEQIAAKRLTSTDRYYNSYAYAEMSRRQVLFNGMFESKTLLSTIGAEDIDKADYIYLREALETKLQKYMSNIAYRNGKIEALRTEYASTTGKRKQGAILKEITKHMDNNEYDEAYVARYR